MLDVINFLSMIWSSLGIAAGVVLIAVGARLSDLKGKAPSAVVSFSLGVGLLSSAASLGFFTVRRLLVDAGVDGAETWTTVDPAAPTWFLFSYLALSAIGCAAMLLAFFGLAWQRLLWRVVARFTVASVVYLAFLVVASV